MKKNKKQYFAYLGGFHKDNGDWRSQFNSIARKLAEELDFQIFGIDPFFRRIDETNHAAIVGRDFSIISDKRLNYVVLRAAEIGAVLSMGTTCEKMFAFFMDKPVVIIGKPECDKSYPSSGAFFPKWYHPFAQFIADSIVPNIEEAVQWIISDIINPQKRDGYQEKMRKLCSQYRFGQCTDFDPFENL